jgi:hypothetical protein
VRFVDSGGTRRPNCITRVGEIFPVGQREARSLPERWPAVSAVGPHELRSKAIDSRIQGPPAYGPFAGWSRGGRIMNELEKLPQARRSGTRPRTRIRDSVGPRASGCSREDSGCSVRPSDGNGLCKCGRGAER